jgi:hypothetical protein
MVISDHAENGEGIAGIAIVVHGSPEHKRNDIQVNDEINVLWIT